jgi:hypothetical protein
MSALHNWKNPVKRKRHAERRRIRRRREFLAKACRTVAAGFFSPEEATDFLFGPLVDARRALRRAERRQAVASAEDRWLPPATQNAGDLPSAPRPRRLLSRLNRSSIFPPLVPDAVEIEALSVHDIVATLQSSYQGATDPQLLDALATASGLSWALCAEILFNRKLITMPIDGDDLVAIRRAREFHNCYGRGRARYAVLVGAGEIQEFQGDWAYFDHGQFQDLLPGMTVPTRLKRHHYFTNRVANGNYSSVDVYVAPTRLPLFQHQFLNDFNPLFFGKPKVNRARG